MAVYYAPRGVFSVFDPKDFQVSVVVDTGISPTLSMVVTKEITIGVKGYTTSALWADSHSWDAPGIDTTCSGTASVTGLSSSLAITSTSAATFSTIVGRSGPSAAVVCSGRVSATGMVSTTQRLYSSASTWPTELAYLLSAGSAIQTLNPVSDLSGISPVTNGWSTTISPRTNNPIMVAFSFSSNLSTDGVAFSIFYKKNGDAYTVINTGNTPNYMSSVYSSYNAKTSMGYAVSTVCQPCCLKWLDTVNHSFVVGDTITYTLVVKALTVSATRYGVGFGPNRAVLDSFEGPPTSPFTATAYAYQLS